MPSSSKELVEPDYASLELLFSVPPTAPREKTGSKPKKKKEHLPLSYSSNEEIAAMIQKGDRSKLDAEILRQLFKLLPEDHEINGLKSCNEEKSELANADQFYLRLLEVPSYQLRIECMLICEETKFLLECLWPKAEAIRTACESEYIRAVPMPRLTRWKLPFYLNSISGSICYSVIKINLLTTGYGANIKMILQIPASRIHAAELPFVLLCFEVELLST
ncbi:inverted formin-2-like [Limosa lapponica baueri]|uniref:Inverted formin-2-like n=1 Tax=Limosa lapponica baueri TaxID=1758121 RepID=A0A2I0TD73_LIMLA|nr:inverted formin-2-like [Limosa lapponica baueri]